MTTILLAAALALATAPHYVKPDYNVPHHPFDYALMTKIAHASAAKRAENRHYDPVTLLPIEEPTPVPTQRRERTDDSSIRAKRMEMAAYRKAKRYERELREQQANYAPMAFPLLVPM